MLAAVGGGGRSSTAVVRGGVSGGLGGDLSNSAMGASSGIGETELLSILLIYVHLIKTTTERTRAVSLVLKIHRGVTLASGLKYKFTTGCNSTHRS